MKLTKTDIIDRLGLQPHPEGGYYREVYRSDITMSENQRLSSATSIYFLLEANDFSAFHRVIGSDEIWHHYLGCPLELLLIHQNGKDEHRFITTEPANFNPMTVVPADCWQAARPCASEPHDYVLAGCTVSPGFDFSNFEMPDRLDLLNRFPKHQRIIEALTRQ